MIKRGLYWAEYLPNHHLANKDGYVYIHRMNAEKKLKRRLLPEECVHHIDENKENNEPDNLMVFKTMADHTAFHSSSPIYLDGDVYVAKMKWEYDSERNKIRQCPICGGDMSYDAKVCLDCYKANKDNHTKRPDKEKLLELIKQYPFTTIGNMFGVSDNAVRKWCRFYNIPFKRCEIKQMLLLE